MVSSPEQTPIRDNEVSLAHRAQSFAATVGTTLLAGIAGMTGIAASAPEAASGQTDVSQSDYDCITAATDHSLLSANEFPVHNRRGGINYREAGLRVSVGDVRNIVTADGSEADCTKVLAFRNVRTGEWVIHRNGKRDFNTPVDHPPVGPIHKVGSGLEAFDVAVTEQRFAAPNPHQICGPNAVKAYQQVTQIDAKAFDNSTIFGAQFEGPMHQVQCVPAVHHR